MTAKNKLNKPRIAAIILTAVSALFFILQKPLYNFLFWRGEVTILKSPIASEKELYAFESGRSLSVFTFSSALFLLEALLFIVYILESSKITARFFAIILSVDIVLRIYSIINLLILVATYGDYPTNIEVDYIIEQYTKSILLSLACLVLYIILLVDALKKHKFLKASRAVISVIAVLNLLASLNNFINNNVIYGIVSSYGLLFTAALLIYYFRIAENKNSFTLESKLYKLKSEYESGKLTGEEYAAAKQNILNKL